MNCIGNVVHIATRYACHTDATIEGAVQVVLGPHFHHLIFVEAAISEHSNLLGDVFPVPRAPGFPQLRLEQNAHGIDPIRHAPAFFHKVRLELWVGQNCFHDACPVPWRIAVHGTDDHLQLRHHARGFVGGRPYDRQSSQSVSVQTKVFGKALYRRQEMTVFHEHANGGGVFRGIAGCKALVRAVEKGHQLSLLHGVTDLLPLFQCRVHACGVVSAGVQQYYTASGHLFQVLHESVKVQVGIFGIVVPVLVHLQAHILENGVVVAPRRIGNVNVFGTVTLDQCPKNAQPARPTQGLDSLNATVEELFAVVTVGKLERQLSKLGIARLRP